MLYGVDGFAGEWVPYETEAWGGRGEEFGILAQR